MAESKTKTQAQEDEAGTLQIKPSEAAVKVAQEDAAWRSDNPDKPRVREASPEVGGESFAYLDKVSG